MRLVCTMFAILFGGAICSSQSRTALFTSKPFTLTSSAVTEGKYEARAVSRTEITSTYQSEYKRKTERTITFKFCLNGSDNERMPGQDHHLTVRGVDGKYVSPVFEFGKSDPEGAVATPSDGNIFLDQDTDVLIRLDMRAVLNAFKTNGSFTTVTGEKISAAQFKNISIAGATFPLTWNFTALPQKPEFRLTDADGDGIYEITLHFPKETVPGKFPEAVRVWTLKEDISRFPRSESPALLVDALYNKALEEMKLDMRDDGAFMAGEMWPGVWTRDVSYSIILSLAAIAPDASKTTLMAKVKNGRIIQDTGTGGSWPVSSDRTIWALAAWEVYVVTGDTEWLAQAFAIVKNSAADDCATVRDPVTRLFCGESSFLDWREQTYPRWMDPKDIYASKNLGTNAVHYQTYRVLAKMAALLGEDGSAYSAIADGIQKSMNSLFWQPEKGYFGQYLYGRTFPSLSPRAEALGEALSVLYDIPDRTRQKLIIEKTPVTAFGVPCIYPQIPNLPPYHNNAVWPFVEAYWGWASAKTGHTASVTHALASVYRAAALYLTNKENLVASTGDFMGTEINSSRQIWSVAGNLAMTYRILYGMTFSPEMLALRPFIPKEYAGTRTLKNFQYRKAMLDITIHGFGTKAASVTMDGKKISQADVPGSLTGSHSLVITLNNTVPPPSPIALADVVVAPETPVARFDGSVLRWNKIPNAIRYIVYKNGKKIRQTTETSAPVTMEKRYVEYQVLAVDASGLESFLSEPVAIARPGTVIIVAAGEGAAATVKTEKNSNELVSRRVVLPTAGTYRVDVEYANGSGPINTDNKCAVRTAGIDGRNLGPIVMSQRGEGNWSEWGYSNALTAALAAGPHDVTLTLLPSDNNMNGEINTALIKSIRFTLVEEHGKKK
jgi:hypothetical protein